MLGMGRCLTTTCNRPHRCQLVITASCQNDPTHMDFPEFSKECQNRESERMFGLVIKRQVIHNMFFFPLKNTSQHK